MRGIFLMVHDEADDGPMAVAPIEQCLDPRHTLRIGSHISIFIRPARLAELRDVISAALAKSEAPEVVQRIGPSPLAAIYETSEFKKEWAEERAKAAAPSLPGIGEGEAGS